MEIQKVLGNVTVKDQIKVENAKNDNKSVILLRTAQSIENKVTRAEHDCKHQDHSIAFNSSTACRKRDIRWYIDSGATKQMTFKKDLILDIYEYEQPSKTYLGDNRAIEAFVDRKGEPFVL